MKWISFSWVFLLGIREYAAIFLEKTTFITIAVTLLQLCNLLLLMENQKLKFCSYHIFLLCIIAIVPINFGALLMVNILLSIILLKDIGLQEILSVSLVALTLGAFVYISAYQLGMIKDVVGLSHKGGYVHTLGFKNPNAPGLYAFRYVLIASLLFIVHFHIRFLVYILIIPVYFLFYLSRGRTGFFAAVLFFFLVFFFSFKLKYRIPRFFALLIPFILYGATFVLCFFVSKFSFVNHFFSSRFSLNVGLLRELSFVNYVVGYSVPAGTPLDSAFLALFITGGVFSVFIFLFVYVKGVVGMTAEKARIFLPYILAVVASGFAESTFSTSSLATIVFYKILIDQFEFKKLRSKYLFRFHQALSLEVQKNA